MKTLFFVRNDNGVERCELVDVEKDMTNGEIIEYFGSFINDKDFVGIYESNNGVRFTNPILETIAI